jgi:tetratricopeptide (TPR) repeat protein
LLSRKSGGHFFRTVLHRDGNLAQTEGNGCHIIHLHGYWYGSDTLHTPRQLNQERPRLKASLSSLAKSRVLVVVGYGGWDDIFTNALMEVVLDDNAFPEIIWTFNSSTPTPSEGLLQKLAPGMDRGRVSLYAGIDCHAFFPKLLDGWVKIQPTTSQSPKQVDHSGLIEDETIGAGTDEVGEPLVLEGGEEDRPPQSDICVGRERELILLSKIEAKACFITGFGGQGKSTIAAHAYQAAQTVSAYEIFVWRDCKEESERFENQLVDIIVRLSEGSSSANDLSHQDMPTLAKLLVSLAGERRCLIVFDNVDHYIDLEGNKLVGNAQKFLHAFLQLPSGSRILFTCRPDIHYEDENVTVLNVGGLGVSASFELFEKRGAASSKEEVAEAHKLTKGHAFWLDLIAAQTAQNRPGLGLRDILDQIKEGNASLPEPTMITLGSIWRTLHDEQKYVLQTMAETVRPETLLSIADYLTRRIKFNRVSRAFRTLRDLNLIVIKPRKGLEDLFELHPLVRQFIRRTFPLKERLTFIDAIIEVYFRFIGSHQKEEKPFKTLQYWTENAELLIIAGKYVEAFTCLSTIEDEFYASRAPGEFARVCKLLFEAIDWEKRTSFKEFDSVFSTYHKIMVNLGRTVEYFHLIERYQATIPHKDARYINLCMLRCNLHWHREEYAEALRWGSEGREIKDRTNVDTQFSTDHPFALAQRDSGQPDLAITHFLRDELIENVINPDEFDEEKHHSFYGNIGRCLHLMGQIDPALVCYRKSALLIQREFNPHVENQGFVRLWIGELLIVKQDFCAAQIFLQAAISKWKLVAPNRATRAETKLANISERTRDCRKLSSMDRERFVTSWLHEPERRRQLRA